MFDLDQINMSESLTNIAVAMVAAQSEIGGALKDSNNPFHKSKYADLPSVLKAVKSSLNKNGISVFQFPISEENKIGVSTMLLHESGEYLRGSFLMPLEKQTPQSAGSAITYAKRYALQAIMAVPSVDDDAEAAEFTYRIDEDLEDDIERIVKRCGRAEIDIDQFESEWVSEKFAGRKLRELRKDQRNFVIKALDKRIENGVQK